MRSRELEPNELQCHTRENTVTVQFCSALQNWPLPLYQVLYQLVELLDPIEVFNWFVILPESTPQGVNTERTHFTNQWLHNYALLTEREVKIARYYEFIFCAFYAHFRWCTIDVRVKRGCQKPISKWSTEMHYTSLWHSFGSVFVQQS